jgi:hypothetical protein
MKSEPRAHRCRPRPRHVGRSAARGAQGGTGADVGREMTTGLYSWVTPVTSAAANRGRISTGRVALAAPRMGRPTRRAGREARSLGEGLSPLAQPERQNSA